ncbi:MAG: UDP-glucose 6-dehydrogenase, partial [Croceicoccus sp.]|nr:UDP-glucose 6-dehydrogenase [Croceicoccus sp.]
MKIAIFGLGYVGLSNAVLLAQHNEVMAVDISAERVAMLNDRKSPIIDAELEEFLANRPLTLTATLDAKEALAGADYVLVATPTNYDVDT